MLLRLNVVLIGAVLLLIAVHPSAATRTVIVVARPFGADAAAIVAQASGDLLKSGRGGAILARNMDSDFVSRLYAAGALFVLDGGVLAGCGETP
jgi:hypothetical protein